MKELLKNNSLVDTLHLPNISGRFTFTDKQHGTKSRLDYIFASQNKYLKMNCKVLEPFETNKLDHKLVISEFQYDFLKQGPYDWKFNSSLLENKIYCQNTEKIINECTDKYNNSLSKQQMWETIKVCVKEYTTSYQRQKNNNISLTFNACKLN